MISFKVKHENDNGGFGVSVVQFTESEYTDFIQSINDIIECRVERCKKFGNPISPELHTTICANLSKKWIDAYVKSVCTDKQTDKEKSEKLERLLKKFTFN